MHKSRESRAPLTQNRETWNGETANANPPVATRVRWILAIWIAVVGAISFLDRVNISIAGHFIARDFHLTNTQLGRVFSAFSVGYMLFQIPGGWLADRLGSRRVLALSVLLWAVFTSLSASVPVGIANALVLFWIIRFLLGIGESAMYPTSNRWLSDWMPVRDRGLANGIIFAGVGAGAALTPPVITALMLRFGWRPAFHTCALLGLVVGLIWLAIARDKPEQHPLVNSAELELIEKETDSDESGSPGLPWSVLLSSKDVWAITFSYFCYGYTAFIFFSWYFIYLTSVRGLDLKSGSYYSMLPFAAMSLCSAGGGVLSDAISRRFGRRWGRCGVACLGLSLAAIFVALGSMAHSPAIASLVLAGGAGALYLSQSSYWAVSADVGGSSSGTLSGMMNMGCQSGSAITAAFTPVIADHIGWTASFLVASVFCILGALTWLVIDPNKVLQYP